MLACANAFSAEPLRTPMRQHSASAAEVLYLRGVSQLHGVAVVRNRDAAYDAIHTAARQGCLVARVHCLLLGIESTAFDATHALQALREVMADRPRMSAKLCAAACNVLGTMHLHGVGGLPKDAEGAVALYRAGAARCPVARHNLGCCYEDGVGVGKNTAIALELFNDAAADGHLDSLYCLGHWFASHGEAVAAVVWFQRAAALGDNVAAFDAAILHQQLSQRVGASPHTRAVAGHHAALQFAQAVRLGHPSAAVHLNTAMAGMFWTFALRGVFSPRFNTLIIAALAAARCCKSLPLAPPEIWGLVFAFLPFESWPSCPGACLALTAEEQ